MPEIIHTRKIFSLSEVTRSIQHTLAQRYTSTFWVKAEMIKLNYYPHSGHCYPDLVEKSDGKIIAQFRANLWRNDYLRVNHEFQKILKEPLKDGIKILLLAEISFDAVYGISLHIQDIDPSFTLGDLEKEKQEAIQQLRKDQLFDANKKLPIPLLPQRIAIISVETSKGFADFRKVIDNNEWGYRFFYFLFPALLQGDRAVESITRQLKQIQKVKHHFDVVAIIRGGGGDVGLSCYNHFELSKRVAEFPLPVITGIGHATNETVTEMVAFHNAITPTKMAEWLIQKFHNFSVPVNEAKDTIINQSGILIQDEKVKFQNLIKYFRSVTQNRIIMSKNLLQRQSSVLIQQAKSLCTQSSGDITRLNIILKKALLLFHQNKRSVLDNVERNITNMSPEKVLKRGYSITLVNGKAVKQFNEVKKGDIIKTVLSKGRILSEIQSTQK
jgi:exodeoxyribonuclease VII large subunit